MQPGMAQQYRFRKCSSSHGRGGERYGSRAASRAARRRISRPRRVSNEYPPCKQQTSAGHCHDCLPCLPGTLKSLAKPFFRCHYCGSVANGLFGPRFVVCWAMVPPTLADPMRSGTVMHGYVNDTVTITQRRTVQTAMVNRADEDCG